MITKSRHLNIVGQLKKREENWDNRFFLDQIPQYETKQQYKLSDANQLARVSNNQKMTEFAPGKIRKRLVDVSGERQRSKPSHENIIKRTTNVSSNDHIVQKYLPQSPKEIIIKNQLVQLHNELVKTWDYFNIISHHREIFEQLSKSETFDRKTKEEIINKEIILLKNDQHPIIKSMKAVKAREKCLLQIQKKMEQFHEDHLQQILELLTHIRILTLNATECIIKWREYLQQTFNLDKQLPAQAKLIVTFLYDHKNYILKMKEDLTFLIQSPLSKYIQFADKDPFLLFPTKKIDKNFVQPIPKNLIQRIRACELILMEEHLDQFHANKSSKKFHTSPNQVKTPLHKFNQSPNISQLSLENKENTPINQKEKFIHQKSQESKQDAQISTQNNTLQNQSQSTLNNALNSQNNVQIQPLDIYEDEFENYYNNYIQNTDDQLKRSFKSDLSDIQTLLQSQNEISFLKLVLNDKQCGLAIIYLDSTFFSFRRLHIYHLSILKNINVDHCIEKLVQFINQNDSCQEIRVSMMHFNEKNGITGVDKQLQEKFIKQGFKWKVMTNDAQGIRNTVFGLRNEKQHIDQPQEPIVIKTSYILCQDELQIKKFDQQITLIDNTFTTLKALQLLEMKSINLNNYYAPLLADVINKNIDIPGSKNITVQNVKELKNFMENNQFINQAQVYISQLLESKIHSSFLNLIFRWKNYKSISYENKTFIRIRNKPNSDDEELIQVARCENINQDVYLIPTDDQKVTVFVYKSSHLLNNHLDQQNISKLKYIESVRNVIKSCSDKIPFRKDLYIQSFSKKVLSDQSNELDQIYEQPLKTQQQSFEFSINYKQQIQAELKDRAIQPNNQVIFKPPFVIGLIQSDIAENMEIPYVSCLIEESDCQ